MLDDPRPLSAADVQPGDPWRPVEVLDRVDSTNAVLVADPYPWRVVTAEHQDRGRGRLGRAWVTTPGAALAVSALVPADGLPLGWLPLVAGLAVADAIGASAGVEARVKWPNDVLLPGDGDRKVAGILCEWTPQGVVVGTGINVAHRRDQLPLDTATSVRLAGGEVTREALLTAYLSSLATLVARLRSDPGQVRERYVRACATIGAEVVVHEPSRVVRGVATGVDPEGRLCLRTGVGPYAVSAGDVVHVRPDGDGSGSEVR